jgi:hypothetical protein
MQLPGAPLLRSNVSGFPAVASLLLCEASMRQNEQREPGKGGQRGLGVHERVAARGSGADGAYRGP